MELPEKINRKNFYNTVIPHEGSSIQGIYAQFSPDKTAQLIADKLDEFHDYLAAKEAQEDHIKHVTGAVEKSIIDQHVTMALAAKEQPESRSDKFGGSVTGKQPSEVVRPDMATVDFLHGKYCVFAEYPTREAAEAARKMLLGNE
jgi:hypothetical protein